LVDVPSAILLDRTIDESGQPRGTIDSIVEHEFEPRRMTQAQAASHLATQKTARMSQAYPDLLMRVLRCEWREVNARGSHVRGDTHCRDRDVADARILYLARNDLREHSLYLGFNSPRPLCLCHELLQGPCNFHSRVALDLVAHAHVLVVLHTDTALGPGSHL